jgi:phosphoribosyl 1,2-cyclic phosphodiesterase
VQLTFCGVRGSAPAPGRAFVRVGGHTSCVAVQHDREPVRLFLDGGSGLQAASGLVADPFDGTVLLGHLHWDHTHGLPFFPAGAAARSRVRVLLPEQDPGADAADAEEVLSRAFSPPHFPVTPAELGPGWSFTSVGEGWFEAEGFRILAREIPHKGGRTFGYRLTSGSAAVAYLSDHDPAVLGPGPDGLGARHDAALALVDGVDVLVHDAQFRAAEFPAVAHLGHASIEYALALGREAGVGTVVLFHHAPTRTDDEIDRLGEEYHRGAPAVVVAVEGAVLEVESAGVRAAGGRPT